MRCSQVPTMAAVSWPTMLIILSCIRVMRQAGRTISMRAMKSGAGSFAICKEYVAAHPQARNIGQVYSVINDLESKRISLDFPEQSLSGRAIKVRVCQAQISMRLIFFCRSMRSYGQQPGREVFTSPFGGRRCRILACQSCRTGSRRV